MVSLLTADPGLLFQCEEMNVGHCQVQTHLPIAGSKAPCSATPHCRATLSQPHCLLGSSRLAVDMGMHQKNADSFRSRIMN